MFWPMAFQYIKQSFINVSALAPWPNMKEKSFYWKQGHIPACLPGMGMKTGGRRQVGMWASGRAIRRDSGS